MGSRTSKPQDDRHEALLGLCEVFKTFAPQRTQYATVEGLLETEFLWLTSLGMPPLRGPVMPALARALPHLPRLNELAITQNFVCVDEEVAALVRALQGSTTLKELVLENLVSSQENGRLSSRRFNLTVQAVAELLEQGSGTPTRSEWMSRIHTSIRTVSRLFRAISRA
eukprot:197138-Prymnesium_polylepis.1